MISVYSYNGKMHSSHNEWPVLIQTEKSSKHDRRRRWHPTPVLLPGKSHGQRSLVGCSPWGHEESDTTERPHFHFSLSCIEEGNGNSLQCSCLENPRDGGAWWAAVSGVTQSRTRLKRLSSSSSTRCGRNVNWCRQERNFSTIGKVMVLLKKLRAELK